MELARVDGDMCSIKNSTSIPKYKRRKISAVRDFPPGCGPNAPRINDFNIAKGPDKALLNPPFWGPTSPNVSNSNISLTNLIRKFPQRRKISAIRDFPPLCGRGAQLTKSELIKSQASGKTVLPQKDGSSKLEKSELEKKTVVSDLKLDEYIGGAEIRKEIVLFDPEKCNTQIHDGVGNEIVVHALQAAPSSIAFVSDPYDKFPKTECSSGPWMKTKEANITSHSGFQKNQVKHGSSSAMKKRKVNKLFEERRALIAGANRKKASSNYIDATPLRSSYPCAIANREDELDTWQQEEGFADFNAGHRLCEIDLPPLVPNNAVILKESHDGEAYNKVREILRVFQAVYRKLTHEDEATVRKGGASRKRIDLDTATILKEQGRYVNTKQVVGSAPGVDVGLEFQFRVELAIVGLHRPLQAGIDYMKQGATLIATSIVASGGYADDMDSADVLNYSGAGGNPSKGEKKFEDQKLERGNLALKNSIAAKNPVRVIRGHDHKISGGSERTRTVKTYTYDGLYIVTKYWQEPGPNGNLVYMFRLERIPGQPELAWNLIKNSKKSKVRHGVCMSDISEGKEIIPICAVNTVDDQKPPSFKYITKMLYPDWCQLLPLRGCDCIGGCSDSASCLCAVRNGGEIPFNKNGSIVEVKPLVYECGPSCKCPPSCSNRVSQFGIKFQLEIFKTETRGWGVRSLNSIPSGSFICEYLGELLEDKQAEQRIGSDEYLFDIGSNFSDQLSSNKAHPQIGPSEVVDDVGFTIDAERYGNIGRFINHSCSPNLYAQNLLYDHEDWRMPHIMLFAADNISPLQELTYHYNYEIGEVRDANGNVKIKRCFCGSADCTGRLY